MRQREGSGGPGAVSAAACGEASGSCGCNACRLDVSILHFRPQPLYKYAHASACASLHRTRATAVRSHPHSHTALTPSPSFSRPLVFDIRSSIDAVIAVRVIIRSLGVCGVVGRAQSEAEPSEEYCYAPQTPDEARACVGAVSAVVFEVRLKRCVHAQLSGSDA